ncbi:hypothetical protein FrEUN1fDRAFT_6793 [Parafrankia sp. EUN1f]|nr:hypothetical protein FrEUN1fDRAFT_6793 [Parafrankia sp. EUN1f]
MQTDLFGDLAAAAPRPRRPGARRRQTADTSAVVTAQLDLAGDIAADLDRAVIYTQLRADRAANWRLDCCTGLPVPRGRFPDGGLTASGQPDWTRVKCGRCARPCTDGPTYVSGHDAGWDGCMPDDYAARARAIGPEETGPAVWLLLHPDSRRLPDIDRAAWLAARHDRAHHADCVCGHPWGWHDRENNPTAWLVGPARCGETYSRDCACLRYVPGPVPPAQPSRWGTSWAAPRELLAALSGAA